jgi:2-(1,2-epoxy-1,2-dihydrophenyl)acetyl-CoA isomerase
MSGPQERARVRGERDGDVWRVVLDDPDRGNVVDPDMARQLGAVLAERPADTRVVLLTAEGPRFCVGGDVKAFAASEDPGRYVGDLAHTWHEVVRALVYNPVPVVAGVHGAVAGAGVGLVGACDLVLCARSTRFTPAYTAIGLSPDGGTSWALARALGAPRALDLMLTNGQLTASEAHVSGLVSRLVDDDALHAEAVELARQVAAGPVRAMVRTRALVRRAAVTGLDEQLDEEARLIAESAADPEGREGVRAFTEKRPADFRGPR